MRKIPVIAAVGAMALTLAACGTSSSGQQAAAGQKLASGKTFTMVLASDPGSLDPDFTSLSAALQVDEFLYDSLINIGPKGNIVAGLADKWHGTTTSATFTLRKGITCSDGSTLTASEVAANISFVGNPKNDSSRISVYVPPGATATGNNATGTVTVTSPVPDAFLLQNVGGLEIVCAKGMQDHGSLKEGADGTGMFTLSQVVPGSQYTLTRRHSYAWGPGNWKANQPGLPDKVVIKVVSNMTTAANLLLSGGVNAAGVIGPDVQRLQASHLFERDVTAPLGELWFNQKAGMPTADEAARKALTQALNLGQLGQVVSSGTGKPPTGLVAPGFTPCRQNTVASNLPAHDVAAAKSALDAAGWKVGPGGIRAKAGKKLSMAVYYATSIGAGMQAGAELVQKVWSSIGVQVTLTGLSDAEISQVIFGGTTPWSAVFIPLGVTLPTQLVGFMSGPTPPKGTDFASISNASYAADVKAASSSVGASGCSQWDAAEEALFQQVDIVPFVDSAVPTFATGATFELSQGSLQPSSIRMLG